MHLSKHAHGRWLTLSATAADKDDHFRERFVISRAGLPLRCGTRHSQPGHGAVVGRSEASDIRWPNRVAVASTVRLDVCTYGTASHRIARQRQRGGDGQGGAMVCSQHAAGIFSTGGAGQPAAPSTRYNSAHVGRHFGARGAHPWRRRLHVPVRHPPPRAPARKRASPGYCDKGCLL